MPTRCCDSSDVLKLVWVRKRAKKGTDINLQRHKTHQDLTTPASCLCPCLILCLFHMPLPHASVAAQPIPTQAAHTPAAPMERQAKKFNLNPTAMVSEARKREREREEGLKGKADASKKVKWG